jgi:hypothetical protein
LQERLKIIIEREYQYVTVNITPDRIRWNNHYEFSKPEDFEIVRTALLPRNYNINHLQGPLKMTKKPPGERACKTPNPAASLTALRVNQPGQ